MMKWITSHGGPFICTDKDTADQWSGAGGLSNIAAEKNIESDYNLACQVYNYAELLGETIDNVLVIGDLPNEIAWIDIGDGDGAFIKWIGADSEEQVLSSIDKLQALVFTDLPIRFKVNSTQLVAFDSAHRLRELGNNYIEFNLPTGDYRVSYVNYAPDDSLSLNVIRLRRL